MLAIPMDIISQVFLCLLYFLLYTFLKKFNAA